MKRIKIPRTPAVHFQPDRLMSELQRNQVAQAHKELCDWFEQHGRTDPRHLRTEQEAADFLAKVTQLLHPAGRTGPALPGKRALKSGVSLTGPQPRTAGAPGKRRARPSKQLRRKR